EVDKVRIYPDKIRLTVGRDNGQILAYDSTPYWAFHHDRDLTNKIALAEARQKLRSDMQIKENRLAVISLPGWQEAFCYEFRVKKDDEEFLVYINAQNGVEEKIQRIIMSPRGEYLQ
ncbi:MAG: peptidase M4, partial [Peptococcaceae bacterium]|nr:peptidase M4 [Peptococcaceae bacterium]